MSEKRRTRAETDALYTEVCKAMKADPDLTVAQACEAAGLSESSYYTRSRSKPKRPPLRDSSVAKAKQAHRYVRGGADIPDACAAAGISDSTYYRWRDQARVLALKPEPLPAVANSGTSELSRALSKHQNATERHSLLRVLGKLIDAEDWSTAEALLSALAK